MAKPYISTKNLRKALDNMLFASQADELGPLENLTLIGQFLSDPDRPAADNMRQYALTAVLSNLIKQELSRHRQNFGLMSPEDTATRDLACAALTLDARQQSPELLGWSLLYHRYIRVDLNITPTELSTLTHTDDRTLRRYQSNAIDRLRDCLVTAEWEARVHLKQSRLLASIPAIIPNPLYGRDNLITRIQRVDSPQHIFITGPTGSGKTVLVGSLLQQQVRANTLDKIVWLDRPASVEYIRQYLQQELLGETKLDLKQYTLLYLVAIVIDDIRGLVGDLESLRRLLIELGEAQVYITNTIYMSISSDLTHFTLTGIDQESARDFIQDLRHVESSRFPGDYVDELWGRVGGNPWAIKLTANSLQDLDLFEPLINQYNLWRIFSDTYQALDSTLQKTILMLALMPAMSIKLSQLSDIWRECSLSDEQMIKLLSCGLLDFEPNSGEFSLNTGAKEHIRELYDLDPEIRQQIDLIVSEIDGNSSPLTLVMIEHILQSRWLALNQADQEAWLLTYCDLGLEAGHYAVWASILADREIPLALATRQAICLRHVSEPLDAVDLLESTIQEAGRAGDFDTQGRALIELSITHRHLGRYEEALQVLSQAEIGRFRGIQGRLATERAQIAVDQGEFDLAHEILEHEPRSLSNLLMLGEITAARDSFHESRKYFDMALVQAAQIHEIARLQAALARIYAQQREHEEAERYFLAALAQLETQNDAFALARCQANFAALLIETGQDIQYAEVLLTEAERQQGIMSDRVGLMYTQHNIRALDHRLAIDEP